MSGLRGVATGALSLVALQAVLSTSASASRFGTLLKVPGTVAERFLNPNTPLFGASSTSSSSTGSTGTSSSAGATSSTGSSSSDPNGSKAVGAGIATLPSSQFQTVPVPSSTPAPVIAKPQ